MKRIFIIIFVLLVCSIKSQSFNFYRFVSMYKMNSDQERTDYLYSKGFVKDDDLSNSSILVFVKKKFSSHTQDFDWEFVEFSNNQLIYSVTNPKYYVNFKNLIATLNDKIESDNNVLIFGRKNNSGERIKIIESDKIIDTKSRKTFNFIYYKN